MRSSLFLSVLVLAATACFPEDKEDSGHDTPEADTDTDADADGDTDSDADSDADADSDTDADTDTGIVDDDGDGYSESEGDCDDGNAAINPSATDMLGDGIDQNCDGVDGTDTDGDGYISGWSGGDDCDDSAASVHPDAVEICWDGIDQDCDSEDPPCSLSDSGVIKFVGEEPYDQAGRAAPAGDINADGHPDLIIGAQSNDEAANGAGAAYVLLGPLSASADLGSADFKLLGEAEGDNAGFSVCGAGDVNGDGVDDLLVGADSTDTAGEYAGTIYLTFGPVTAGGSLGSSDVVLHGPNAGDHLGYPVVAAGDINADGFADFAVGAREDDEAGSNAGAAYLVFGPMTGGGSLADTSVKLLGEAANDRAATSIASAGDVDGDGFGDIVVGAHLNDTVATDTGAAYLVRGPCSTDIGLADAEARMLGEAEWDWAAYSVGGAGDTNGDGYADVIVGARANTSGGAGAGAAYIVNGPFSGDLDLAAADAKMVGEEPSDTAGVSVAGAGDVDADGFADVLIGAWSADGGKGPGAAYQVYGPFTASIDLSLADVKFLGENDHDAAGFPVEAAGDMDGDGHGDLLVGALYNDEGGEAAGAAYLLLFSAMP